ncbi:hypothetical protein F2Q69_00021855 [Brassica cretica]|uniref:Uncharacterized protein n=1 Tax=Brassica cretica TaxID=69181 RepID=A0A8S9Q6U8_BRACR|nr:hypothetical protein F2Q69_00021855 [Brassica cretica]
MIDFGFFIGETIFRCDLINFTGSDSHIFETDEQVGSEPSDGAFKFQVSSPSENRSHFFVGKYNLSFACRLLTLVFFPDDAPISLVIEYTFSFLEMYPSFYSTTHTLFYFPSMLFENVLFRCVRDIPFVVMDELGLPSRMFETGLEPMGKKRVNNHFN